MGYYLSRPESILILSVTVMYSAAARAVSGLTLRTVTPVIRQQSCAIRKFGAASTFLNPDDVAERIVSVVRNFDKVDPKKVTPEAKFGDDLGLDSLDSVEVVMAIEDEFAIEIPDAEADQISSITDATEYISGHPMAK